MIKKIAVLGCTGSIGAQTLDIVRSFPDEYKIVGLSCAKDWQNLVRYAEEFDCRTLGIADGQAAQCVEERIKNANVFRGDEALTSVSDDADIVVVAVVGMIGLKAVLYALGKNKIVALANKESLVTGGALVREALKKGGEIRPVDSEHSAVWQALRGEKNFRRIILTASGGPFLNTDEKDFQYITPERAVMHPNWKMGRKISVDSATMMNKGLEIIEARWLFDTLNIDYVIHPESIVHSMVEFRDGSIKAQASFPDMRLPILYALSYPDHAAREFTPIELPLALRFMPPDEKKFRAPALARAAMTAGGNAPAVLNAANEAAVALFLQNKISFTDIINIVEDSLGAEPYCEIGTADDVFATHNRVYETIYLKYRGE